MNPIIVMNTTGKSEDVTGVKIRLFDTIEEANDYRKRNTDNPMNQKYWSYCEIIDEGVDYEPAQYKNYK